MEKFTFYIDQKKSEWDREVYFIEGENREAATAAAIRLFNFEEEDSPHEVISVGNVEIMLEPTPGNPTRELLIETNESTNEGELIISNAPKAEKFTYEQDEDDDKLFTTSDLYEAMVVAITDIIGLPLTKAQHDRIVSHIEAQEGG